ncbi:MAG TPA: iron-containing redox enzyme family protein [Nitrospiraceae bacterium]|jgi:pyrroloquinoline quinone (PQQ) biosynthesis protein C|nr:iron-containing redox enzyme family protein [Nitrospiraceae bacterium]
MTFFQEMRNIVLGHGAINNSYLDRFQSGDLTDADLGEFATEFYNFARFFPQILVSQLVNTEDEKVADELTKVLYSELGDGQTHQRHELLYRDFLRSIGIEVHWAMSRPMLPSTRAYIEGMEQLYSDGNHAKALGASFGLENMAITMWDHLIPGLTYLKTSRYPHMDITYFTFHRQLESTHEAAMEHAVAAVQSTTNAGMSDQDKNDFRCGVNAVLGYLEDFWMGLERRGSPDREPHEIHHHAA